MLSMSPITNCPSLAQPYPVRRRPLWLVVLFLSVSSRWRLIVLKFGFSPPTPPSSSLQISSSFQSNADEGREGRMTGTTRPRTSLPRKMKLGRVYKVMTCLTTLWGICSVVMLCFVFFWRLPLPAGLRSSCSISSTACGALQNSRLSGRPRVRQ